MFEKHSALFLYAVSPVHMGAGTAVGLIDNPIQRESHTRYPSFAGAGLKGAFRHGFVQLGGIREHVALIFGPESASENDNRHAGALSIGDAMLVAFPVRSLRGGFVYATSPTALARTQRLLSLLGTGLEWPPLPRFTDGSSLVVHHRNCGKEEPHPLHLEAFEYSTTISADLEKIAGELAAVALPAGKEHDYFRKKFASDLVVLSDTDFAYFVEHATSVETHVRIDPNTGVAVDGGLFYTENLPPESLLLAPVMASATRSGKDDWSAERVMENVRSVLDGKLLQIGANATTGRGQVLARLMGAMNR